MHLLDLEYFKSIDGDFTMLSSQIEKGLPPQIPLDDTVYERTEIIANSMQSTGIATGASSAAATFFVGASLGLAFGMLHMI